MIMGHVYEALLSGVTQSLRRAEMCLHACLTIISVVSRQADTGTHSLHGAQSSSCKRSWRPCWCQAAHTVAVCALAVHRMAEAVRLIGCRAGQEVSRAPILGGGAVTRCRRLGNFAPSDNQVLPHPCVDHTRSTSTAVLTHGCFLHVRWLGFSCPGVLACCFPAGHIGLSAICSTYQLRARHLLLQHCSSMSRHFHSKAACTQTALHCRPCARTCVAVTGVLTDVTSLLRMRWSDDAKSLKSMQPADANHLCKITLRGLTRWKLPIPARMP